MKRQGNIYADICSIDNLYLADEIAQKGKKHQYGVKDHNKKRDANLQLLHRLLVTKTYKTSPYTTFPIYEPKQRIIYRLPYFPDRIVHHAVMNKIRHIFIKTFTADTYSCIKNRGIHAVANAVKKALKCFHPSGGGGGYLPCIVSSWIYKSFTPA